MSLISQNKILISIRKQGLETQIYLSSGGPVTKILLSCKVIYDTVPQPEADRHLHLESKSFNESYLTSE